MGVFWSPAEQQAVTEEGIRLQRSGKFTSVRAIFFAAQSVLPNARRRSITTTAKVPWFTAALKDARTAQDGPQSAEQQRVAITPPPPPASSASEGESGGGGSKLRVHWTQVEMHQLCAAAARLVAAAQASGPRDALEKAMLELPPERRRTIFSMLTVASWYPDGLKKAIEAQRREVEAALRAKAREDAKAAAKAAAPAEPPLPVVEAVMARAVAPATPFSAVFGNWTHIREHLVNEIASIVAEGIHRGLASVQLAAPPAAAAESMEKPAQHVPFVFDPYPKARPPSVLIVGLKGGQVPQIKADFGSKLDLRFCDSDKSKDQLRQMTEQADATVAVVDFLSHSHTDIIKARAKHYVESAGGMTHLRQQLARMSGVHLNGSAAVAGPG